jgi:hypothetical protein
VTEHDIRNIEQSLNVSLPRAYRDAVCPFSVRAYIGNTDTPLWDDASKLIELNQRLHREEGWPAKLYALGEEQDGSQMAIDLTDPKLTVWWIDRRINAPGTGPLDEGFTVWAAELVRQFRTCEYEDGFDPENDPPGTRGQDEPIPVWFWLGCAGGVVVIAVVLALAIFGFQVLFGRA